MTDITNNHTLVCISNDAQRNVFLQQLKKWGCNSPQIASNINETKEILSTAAINFLIIECSDSFVKLPKDLHHLTGKFKNLKVLLLVLQNYPVKDALMKQYKHIADMILHDDCDEEQINEYIQQTCNPGKAKNIAKKPQAIRKANSAIKQAESQPVANERHNALQENDSWNLFFEDSKTAQLIVNAKTHQITHANSAFLTLLQLTEDQVIGKDWSHLDTYKNQDLYKQYSKELTTKEQFSFNIIPTINGQAKRLNANFQMGTFNSEIIFIGQLTTASTDDIPDAFSRIARAINDTDVMSARASEMLEQLRNHLQLDYIFFFENRKEKGIKPTYAGDKSAIIELVKNAGTQLQKLLKKSDELVINYDQQSIQNILENAPDTKLCSFAFYPVEYKSCIYGAIVLASKSKIEKWKSMQVLISLLLAKYRLSLYQKNILEQKELEGLSDKLTGLPNRNAMTKKFAELNEIGIEDGKYISLMIIALHKINHLNKNLGIELTNQLIKSIAQIITRVVRNKGEIYRLSGDEFLVLLKTHDEKKQIESLAKVVLKQLETPILLSSGEEQRANVNIGISIFPDDGQTVSSMMKNADLAMYDAKLAGMDNFVTFKHSETGKALKQKTQMEENLRKAITEGHIKVFYQPKIDAITEDIIGFEALVRWIDPLLGMINPGHFIPLAEETGLINEIGEYITKRSCENVIEWQKTFGLNLSCSINVSPVQLRDKNLPQKLERIINSTGVLPQYIDFEITETINIDTVPNLVSSLDAITKIGCTLSIDDFGTGHSSLDYVKRIPANYIKIDQTFVANIGLNPEDEAILDATISIAKRLNRKLIAEGVETEQQREYLLERKCDYFQGFLFSRPLPEDEINRLLVERAELMG